MNSKTENADLRGSEFINTNLEGAKFSDVNLAAARFVDVTFAGTQFENVSLEGVVIRDANCTGLTIEAARYAGMRIDGILVTDLLQSYHAQRKLSTQSVSLADPDPRWPGEYASEAALITGAMGSLLVALRHIGSTAIPGICAKPIIDILAVVDDLSLLDAGSSQLEKLGYEGMGEFGIPHRRYFRKSDASGNRTHQIHAFQASSSQIARHLAFRDFMRAHPEYALQYESLKRQLAALYPSRITDYAAGKDDFIKEMDAKAAAWRLTLRSE